MNRTGRDNTWTDQWIAEMIGAVLRSGVVIAASVILFGALVYLVRHGLETPRYGAFSGEPPELCSVGSIVKCALSLSGRGIIQLGCLLLILTPIMSVTMALAGFVLQRNRIYIMVTLVVLGLLLVSLLEGGHIG